MIGKRLLFTPLFHPRRFSPIFCFFCCYYYQCFILKRLFTGGKRGHSHRDTENPHPRVSFTQRHREPSPESLFFGAVKRDGALKNKRHYRSDTLCDSLHNIDPFTNPADYHCWKGSGFDSQLQRGLCCAPSVPQCQQRAAFSAAPNTVVTQHNTAQHS